MPFELPETRPSLADLFPAVAAMLKELDPTKVFPYSRKKMLWICELGHEWSATPTSQIQRNSCPICSRRTVLAGFNDLATTHPEIAAQAHGWDPTSVHGGDANKRNWICKFSHVTEARIADKCKSSGCPVCSGRKALAGFNDLATTNPEVAAQADGWDPKTVTFGSSLKKSWRCELGHKWDAPVCALTNGVGCPICDHREVLKGFNDFATTHPVIAAQADGWDTSSVFATSVLKAKWKCEFGHSWVAQIKNRSCGAGCAVCAGQLVQVGFNDLATTNPELAAQADGWDPQTVTKGTPSKKQWKCDQGHSWIASVGSRSGGHGCPVCASRQVLAGYNDLASVNPEIAAQAVGWDPRKIAPKSGKKMLWQCPLGHQYRTTVANRSEGKGCPFCSGRQVLMGFNDLGTTHPEIAREAHEWDPGTVSAGSHKRADWKCELGHVWDQIVKERTLQGFGCSYCSGKRVLPGFNDLATTHPEIAIQAEGWDPTLFSKGHNKKKNWKCDHGHIYLETVNHRTHMKTGCPVCSGNQILVGFNDLATTSPELALEVDGWDPTTITRGSNRKVRWKCPNGHTWKTSPTDRARGEGCPSCSKSGFDPNKEGWLYLVYHEGWDLIQVGLTNHPENRLTDHRRSGFDTVLDIRGPMEGVLAQNLERKSLHALKKRGAKFSNRLGVKKFDGYSEAWTKASLNATSIKQLLDWVYEDDEAKST
jgi:hypothetical protein